MIESRGSENDLSNGLSVILNAPVLPTRPLKTAPSDVAGPADVTLLSSGNKQRYTASLQD